MTLEQTPTATALGLRGGQRHHSPCGPSASPALSAQFKPSSSRNSIVHIRRLGIAWSLVFGVVSALASVAFALTPSVLSFVLWPGVGLYTLLNGALLFGAGFGTVGNYLIIALGSAAIWASLFVLVRAVASSFPR